MSDDGGKPKGTLQLDLLPDANEGAAADRRPRAPG